MIAVRPDENNEFVMKIEAIEEEKEEEEGGNVRKEAGRVVKMWGRGVDIYLWVGRGST